jgi:cytochrome b561
VQPRYSPLNQALHWITAICMLAILPLARVMTSLGHAAPDRDDLFNWHKTLGIIVLLVTAFRIAWRFVDRPPPYQPTVAKWERGLAKTVYWLFFALLIWMPVTGFLTSYYGGHPVRLFDIVPTPQILPENEDLADLFGTLHVVSQWAIYLLIVLHLCAVAFHLIWVKDGLLGRMLPRNAAEPPQQL